MKSNQNSSSTNYSQQIPSANMGNQSSFNSYYNVFQQIMNMKLEIEQLKAQNMKHQTEMNQMEKKHNLEMNKLKKSVFNQEKKHNLEMKNIIDKFQHKETMLKEEIRVQGIISQTKMENRFKLVSKEISDLKTNYSNLNQEISNIKSSEELLNSIKPLLKNLSNNLTSFNEKNNSMEIMILKNRVDDIKLKIMNFLKIIIH